MQQSIIDKELIKFPDANALFYLIDDLQKVGLWASGESLNDQALFYYSKLHKVELESFEIELMKQCSSAYVNSYRANDNTINACPFAPLRTQEEVDAKDDRLLRQMKKGL